MNVKELENILNSNRLDLRQLNSVQRLFIDKLQKKGIIETKPLDTLEKEQLEAREEVAKEKNLYADPIKAMTADKLNRNKVATYTDIGLLMAQLLMDRKRLDESLDQFIAQALDGYTSIDDLLDKLKFGELEIINQDAEYMGAQSG